MANQNGYQVTGQVTDQFQTTQAGRNITGTIIYFITDQGQEGSLFVEDNQYPNVAATKHALAQKAKLLNEVANLAENMPQG